MDSKVNLENIEYKCPENLEDLPGLGIPPANNVNYAWIEHIISKLSPKGVAGYVLANGSISTATKAEAEIRKNIIEAGEAGLVDCIVTMPPNLFYNVTIPVCLWYLAKKRDNRKGKLSETWQRINGGMFSIMRTPKLL